MKTTVAVALVGVLALSGCKSIGPGTIPTDRFDYGSSIADSWKQQTLLNIVKLRYLDLPVFVDVSSVVAGYSLQTGVSISGVARSDNSILGNSATIGGQAIYTDRPTVTYVPLTGEKFLRGLMTPIEPKDIFFMIQSGYAADFVLALTVDSLNGVRNRASGVNAREADPAFVRVLALLREVQAAGALGLRVEVDKVKGASAVIFFRRDNAPPEISDDIAEIGRLLGLRQDQQRFDLVYSPAPGAPNEFAVGSRSMLQIMSAFASYADVPEQDLKDGRALPAPVAGAGTSQQVKIANSKDKPANAFAAVHYRDQWFWIDDRDWRSKRALTAVMFFFTMAQTGGNEQLPVVTIPAQ